MYYEFWRETSTLIMSGSGRSYDSIEELKEDVKEVYEEDFDDPGFRWEIEQDGVVFDSGRGRPLWAQADSGSMNPGQLNALIKELALTDRESVKKLGQAASWADRFMKKHVVPKSLEGTVGMLVYNYGSWGLIDPKELAKLIGE